MTRLLPRLLPLLALVLLAPPAAANTQDCGGNAYSHAGVVSRPPGVRARGPVTSVPDSLCADLVEDRPRPIESLGVHIGPDGAGVPMPLPRRAPPQP